MKELPENLKLILHSLPEKPGVYRFLDEEGTIIYVGKAKRLKRRVSSYFNKEHVSAKVRLLVAKIRDIQTTVVDNEWEALLLENSMIKQFKPHYNILLKDDKSYPWIAITKEEYPRIFATRHPEPHKMQLFGPYSSLKHMNDLLETIHTMFPLRNCRRLVHNERPCMQYQIKKCNAPCCGLVSATHYQENIRKIINIINGNRKDVIRQLKEDMAHFSEQWEFEKAAVCKKQIQILQEYVAKSVVVSPTLTQLDVFGMKEDETCAYISFLRIIDGAIVQAHLLEINNKLDSTPEDLLWNGILAIQERIGNLFHNVVVPFNLSLQPDNWEWQVPQRGEKKKLLELAERNAHFYQLEKFKRQDLVNPERRNQRVLQALQQAIGMKRLPRHIECFDNSNTQGDDPVGAMVCFIDGKPAKKEYRHFNIKTVIGADDFATMTEVVYRRYHRLLEEGKPLPDLIVIDGGKGQLNAAYRALQELHIENQLSIVGIAKRLEDIYKPGDDLPIYIDKRSEAQKLLQEVRDAVHDFGINHHRKRRTKSSMTSILDNAPGIGPVLKQKLLSTLKSVKRIREATEDDLSEIIGPQKAKKLFLYLHEK